MEPKENERTLIGKLTVQQSSQSERANAEGERQIRTSTIARTDRGFVPEQIELADTRSNNNTANAARNPRSRQGDMTDSDKAKSDGDQSSANSGLLSGSLRTRTSDADSRDAQLMDENGNLAGFIDDQQLDEAASQGSRSWRNSNASNSENNSGRESGIAELEAVREMQTAIDLDRPRPQRTRRLSRKALEDQEAMQGLDPEMRAYVEHGKAHTDLVDNSSESTISGHRKTGSSIRAVTRHSERQDDHIVIGENSTPRFELTRLSSVNAQDSPQSATNNALTQAGPSNAPGTLADQQETAARQATRIKPQENAEYGTHTARPNREKSHRGTKRNTSKKLPKSRAAKRLYRSHEDAGTSDISSFFQKKGMTRHSNTSAHGMPRPARSSQARANRGLPTNRAVIDVDEIAPSPSLLETREQSNRPRSIIAIGAPADLVIPEVPQSSSEASNTNRQGRTGSGSGMPKEPIDDNAFPSPPLSPTVVTRNVRAPGGTASAGLAPPNTADQAALAAEDETVTHRFGHERTTPQMHRTGVSERPPRPPRSWPRGVAFAPSEVPPPQRRQQTLNEVMTIRERSPDRVRLLPNNQEPVQQRRQATIEEVMTVRRLSSDRIELGPPPQQLDRPEPLLQQTAISETQAIRLPTQHVAPAVGGASSLQSGDTGQQESSRNRSRERERHPSR